MAQYLLRSYVEAAAMAVSCYSIRELMQACRQQVQVPLTNLIRPRLSFGDALMVLREVDLLGSATTLPGVPIHEKTHFDLPEVHPKNRLSSHQNSHGTYYC